MQILHYTCETQVKLFHSHERHPSESFILEIQFIIFALNKPSERNINNVESVICFATSDKTPFQRMLEMKKTDEGKMRNNKKKKGEIGGISFFFFFSFF